ncbi:MAG: DUF3656 domain-containing protein [Caldilineaceae bacterium]
MAQPANGGRRRRVYQVTLLRNGQLELQFGNGAVNFARIRPGDLVWRTDDPDLDKAARPFTQATAPVHKQPLHVQVTAHEGAPLRIAWTLVEQPQTNVTVQSPEPLIASQNRPLSPELLREQLGRLGNTPYDLATVEPDVYGQPFAPASLLNQLRRQAVEQLVERQSQSRSITLHDPLATLEAALTTIHPPRPPQGREQYLLPWGGPGWGCPSTPPARSHPRTARCCAGLTTRQYYAGLSRFIWLAASGGKSAGAGNYGTRRQPADFEAE